MSRLKRKGDRFPPLWRNTNQCVPAVNARENLQTVHLGSCNDQLPCAEDMFCERLGIGGVCKHVLTCASMNSQCSSDRDCCDGLACVGEESSKACLEVRTHNNGERCMPLGSRCNFGIDCCGGSTCARDGNEFRCLALPQCWSEPFKNCDQDAGMPGCCEGFICVEDTTVMTQKEPGNTGVDDIGTTFDNADFKLSRPGSRVCKPTPKCAALYGDCRLIDCCSGGDSPPLQCAMSGDRMLCMPVAEVPKTVPVEKAPISTFENNIDELKETPKVTTPVVNPAPAVDGVPGPWIFSPICGTLVIAIFVGMDSAW